MEKLVIDCSGGARKAQLVNMLVELLDEEQRAAFAREFDALAPCRVEAKPIATGFGFVDCAHGRLPIPAPATANILEGMPHFAGGVEGELCTPTGAALVRHFAEAFVE